MAEIEHFLSLATRGPLCNPTFTSSSFKSERCKLFFFTVISHESRHQVLKGPRFPGEGNRCSLPTHTSKNLGDRLSDTKSEANRGKLGLNTLSQ